MGHSGLKIQNIQNHWLFELFGHGNQGLNFYYLELVALPWFAWQMWLKSWWLLVTFWMRKSFPGKCCRWWWRHLLSPPRQRILATLTLYSQRTLPLEAKIYHVWTAGSWEVMSSHLRHLDSSSHITSDVPSRAEMSCLRYFHSKEKSVLWKIHFNFGSHTTQNV